MAKITITALLISAAVILTPGFGRAAPPCDTRERTVAQLKGKYKEFRIGRGVTKDNRVAELFISKDGNTWTIILTDTDGRSCMGAAGDYWLIYQPPKEPVH